MPGDQSDSLGTGRRILVLNSWHGGSHQAFLDAWISHSRHRLTVLSLPAFKWKWRMRHSAVTFARLLHEAVGSGSDAAHCEATFCTDMLNLAEFRGLCPDRFRHLPTAVYFHENQLTYPVREERERDLHFAYSNFTTAVAADAVWFNSAWHREDFLTALDGFLNRMPDFQHVDLVEQIRSKSAVHHPGISDDFFATNDAAVARDSDTSLRIAWVSRWEHDKQPEMFFEALRLLRSLGIGFRLRILGESFGTVPDCFHLARAEFADQIDHWGYAESRDEYLALLRSSDVVVSTASHEFFGIAILEAVAAGCRPLVPRALAYPETLGPDSDSFHDGTAAGLAIRLAACAAQKQQDLQTETEAHDVRRFSLTNSATALDDAIEILCDKLLP